MRSNSERAIASVAGFAQHWLAGSHVYVMEEITGEPEEIAMLIAAYMVIALKMYPIEQQAFLLKLEAQANSATTG